MTRAPVHPLLVACLAAALLLAARPAAAADPAPPEQKARALLDALTKKDFEAAGRDFDDRMKKALPTDDLAKTWNDLTRQLGALRKQGEARIEKKGRFDVVIVPLEFEKAKLDAWVSVDADGQVGGLFFRPAQSRAPYQAPAYVNRDAFQETDVQVGSGEWALPGTLALPVGDGPFPGVVLVHGSGPNDRDETVNANKPFRDLAWGLASQGVAVLRYDKRTRVHGAKMVASKGPLTVKEEVVDDALEAVKLLRKAKGINPRRVFVLGHSLGAVMAPRIGSEDPEIAGLILLAGNSRPLEDVYLEQVEYLYSLGGPLSDEDRETIEKIKAQVARLKDLKLSPDTPAKELPLGQPAAYWLALRDYHATEVAAKLKQPMLILQGERDYQVTMEDFAGWKKALAGQKNVTFKSYPALNHLFVEGQGKSRPEEYDRPGHVAREVIDDIAGWIKEH